MTPSEDQHPLDDLMPSDDLSRAFADPPQRLQELQDRLAASAHRAALIDVRYRTLDTPVGLLLLAGTEVGLVRVAFANEDHDRVLQLLADRISPRILRHPASLDAAAQELDQYFSGLRRAFDVPLDWRLSGGFRNTVLHQLTQIGFGDTASYAAVAVAAGNPKAVRAVGSACATNPLPVIVPCHRVIRSDGALGGYLGGVQAKQFLLAQESAA